MAEQPGRHPGDPRQQQTQRHHRVVVAGHAVVHPAHPGRHVLQQQRHRRHQAGDETAAGQIVAAQEDIHRYQQGQRQQRPRDRHQHQRVRVPRPRPAGGIRPRRGQLEILEQRVDTHGGDAQHGDFTEGIEAPEVHQDHVDHIGATAARLGVLQEETADAVEIAGHHGERHDADAAADHHRQEQIAEYSEHAGFGAGAHRQKVHRQDQQHHRDHFHGKLGERQIRRREAHEHQRHHQPHHADRHDRRHPVAVQDGGDHGGHDQHGAGQQGHPVQGKQGPVTTQQTRSQLGQQHQRHHRQQPGHIGLQGAVTQAPAQCSGEPRHRLHGALENQVGVDLRQARVPPEQALPLAVDQHTANQSDDAHQQRQVKAVPDGKMVFRQGAAKRGGAGHRQQPGHGKRREHAHRHAQRHENLHRHLHVAGRLMGREFRQIHRLTVEENVVDKAGRIGHRQHAAQGGAQRQHPAQSPEPVRLQRLGEEHFLGQEAVEQRHPGHRRRGHHGQHRGVGHVAPQAIDSAHVPGTGFVINNARGHEQRRLEGGMVDDMEHRRHRRQLGVQAEQQRDQTQMADGGVGQQSFQVVLEQCRQRAPQQRRHAGQRDQVEPQVGSRQHRVEPGQQKHPRLDHGGGMQVSAYWRRRRHGMGQPEVERKLGAFGENAQQHQAQNHRVEAAGADGVATGQRLAQGVAAHHLADQQHPGEQRQAAQAGDRERHARPLPGAAVVRPETDQQERAEAGELPEHHQQQQVVTGHHPQHGAHEEQQVGVKPPGFFIGGQVVARVQNNQQADAQHQHGEHERQAVQAERQVQAQAGQPLQ